MKAFHRMSSVALAMGLALGSGATLAQTALSARQTTGSTILLP